MMKPIVYKPRGAKGYRAIALEALIGAAAIIEREENATKRLFTRTSAELLLGALDGNPNAQSVKVYSIDGFVPEARAHHPRPTISYAHATRRPDGLFAITLARGNAIRKDADSPVVILDPGAGGAPKA